jgi:dihydroorotate dehydrogenase (fumarate)
MDLTTKYLGLTLKNPVVAASSPLSRDIDNIKRLEDAGAAAVVMYSLFEEQINYDKHELDHFLNFGGESFAEALNYFPEPKDFANLDADEYLEHVRKAKKAVSIPVIASLNGVSRGGWMRYARLLQDAGADALELNVYYIAADPSLSSSQVEQMYLDDLKTVKKTVSIPVSIKLSPYFSSFANFACCLDHAGADGLVLFNRFLGPELDLRRLEVVPKLSFSHASEIRLPVRWTAILFGRIKADIAATSGIHSHEDVIRCIMAGASVTQVASIILQRGVDFLSELVDGIRIWGEEHEYESVTQMKGSMSCQKIAEPAAYERANYMKALQSYS